MDFNNNGTIDIQSESTLTNQKEGALDNGGSLRNAGTLTNTGVLTNSEGGTLTNNGTIDTTGGTYINYETYNGSGNIVGDHTDYGVTGPGEGAGVIMIDGDYSKVEGSQEFELGGPFDGGGDKSLTEFDWIDATGNVELAGILEVELVDGFEIEKECRSTSSASRAR